MARYRSGISGDLPGEDIEDPRARAAQMALEMDAIPIATTAPCMNPECGGPVDFLGNGPLVRYCSSRCRNRASQLRRRALQQLALIERTLAEAKNLPGVPREEFHQRAQLLKWWLLRLAPADVNDEDV